MYYETIGHGTTLNLNVPPDKRGLIHENDVRSLMQFKKIFNEIFSTNLAGDAKIEASSIRGKSEKYSVANLTDGNKETFWSTNDNEKETSLTIDFNSPVSFNVIDMREFAPLGQRVFIWAFDRWENNKWVEFAKGEAIGLRRIWRDDEKITSPKLRIRLSGPVCPAISELGVYAEPDGLIVPPIKKK
jgi:alpha-L-fucosidase